MFKTRISGIAVAVSLLMLPTAPSLVSAADEIEEVVAVGTRREARSVGDSPAPVDIISGSDFTNQGAADLPEQRLPLCRSKSQALSSSRRPSLASVAPLPPLPASSASTRARAIRAGRSSLCLQATWGRLCSSAW